jgi:hypothetical protein
MRKAIRSQKSSRCIEVQLMQEHKVISVLNDVQTPLSRFASVSTQAQITITEGENTERNIHLPKFQYHRSTWDFDHVWDIEGL